MAVVVVEEVAEEEVGGMGVGEETAMVLQLELTTV